MFSTVPSSANSLDMSQGARFTKLCKVLLLSLHLVNDKKRPPKVEIMSSTAFDNRKRDAIVKRRT